MTTVGIFDASAYLLDHYGTCEHGAQCLCLKPGSPWLGRACPWWRTAGASTVEELFAWMKQKQEPLHDDG